MRSKRRMNRPGLPGGAESGETSEDRRKRRDPLNHQCQHCGKTFGSPGKLQQHLFIHTGERPFSCDVCPKSFSSKFKLMRHALIHSEDRQFRCSLCDRCFHRKDHLKNHLQVHNPDKKVHKCLDCSKEYNSRLSYRKHIAIHAAEAGDLECKVCGKMFNSTQEIMYHLKVHAGSRTVKSPYEKRFKCEFCERHFFTRKDVKRHLVVHTGKRDFLCQFCPQRFGRKDHLVRHIKKSHNALAKQTSVPSGHDFGQDFSYPPPPPDDMSGNAMMMVDGNHLEHKPLRNNNVQSIPHNNHSGILLSELTPVSAPHHLHHPPPTSFSALGSASATHYYLPSYSNDLVQPVVLQSHQESQVPTEYKPFEDGVKMEREDLLYESLTPANTATSVSAVDLNQILGLIPLTHLPTQNATSLSTPVVCSVPLSSAGIPSIVTASLSTPLPRFNQAFQ